MGTTVELPEPLAARLAAEAAARGVTVEAVAIEALADRYAPDDAGDLDNTLAAFIGCGASGRTEPLDLRDARHELAARNSPLALEPGRGERARRHRRVLRGRRR